MQLIKNRTSSGARSEGALNAAGLFKESVDVTVTNSLYLPRKRERRQSPDLILYTLAASQQSAQRATHERAADRAAKLAADRFAEIGNDAAHHLVGDGARDIARDALAGRQPAAAGIGAEDGADDRADLPENAAALAGATTIGRGRGAGDPLLYDLVGGLGIDCGVVFALDRARIHD